MATETMREIDWDTFPESDGEPMAETQANMAQMVDLIFALASLVKSQGRGDFTAVGGNQLMYYNKLNGRDHISPDVYVILDYPPPPPPSWRMWDHGKFPEIIFEITSPSTADNDVSEQAGRGKRWRYGTLGVKEYYIYDPQGELEPPLQGFALQGTRLEPMEALAGGSLYSPLLGAELRQVDEFLRVIDPTTGLPFLTPMETQERLTDTEERLTNAQGRLTDTEGRLTAMQEQLSREQRVLLAMQKQLSEEKQARLAMEETLRDALARLAERNPPA